jgi:hypothetical protein
VSEAARRIARSSRLAQGLTPTIADAVVISRLAILMAGGRKGASRD